MNPPSSTRDSSAVSCVLANCVSVVDGTLRQYFDAQMVVSRDATGNPLSRYGEPRWDLTSQSIDATTKATMSFFPSDDADDPPLAAVMHEQNKALMWASMDSDPIPAVSTIRSASYAALAWCRWAYERRLDLFTVLASPVHVADACHSMTTSYLDQTPRLVRTLCRHRELFGVDSVPLQALRDRIADERNGRSEDLQTPLIPSRIYSSVLAGLLDRCSRIESMLGVLLDSFHRSKASSRNVPASASHTKRIKDRARDLADIVKSMQKLGYVATTGASIDGFIVNRMRFCQAILMHTIAAFSGVRRGEMLMLPAEGVLETFRHRGAMHYEIHGYTSKLNHGIKQPASWVTSREGALAIRLAQRIARAVHREFGADARAGQEALLFPSILNPFRQKSQGAICRFQDQVIEEICPEVSQADIDELDRMELDRGWQREGIEVGRRWPLAFHQLRRSLSVYAHRSGIVSLPSLKAQLQHITDEMRSYYSDGYCSAVNMVYDPGHFSHDWNAGQTESSYFGYVIGLLFSEEDLLGEGAVRMNQVLSSRNRAETLKLFQQGKLAYKETVLGGCAAIGDCKSQPLEPIPFDCLKTNCVNLVVTKKRLDWVIQSQQSVVAVLAGERHGSVEHRLEVSNLQTLLNARQNLKAPNP